MQFIGVCFIAQYGGSIVIGKSKLNDFSIVHEIQYESISFKGMRPVEARQGLNCLDPGKLFIHIHGMQKRLVITCLKFISDNKKTIGIIPECVRSRDVLEYGLV